MNLVNLTPHEVKVFVGDEAIATFPKAATPARASQSATVVGEVNVEGHLIPIVSATFGDLQDAPPEQDDTTYIVSLVAGQAMLASERTDFLLTYDPVRDDEGKIIGCRKFARL